ncbi:MAG: long-chain fatty acid--CoA ligase [Deltaproteobacteria bacterium]|nr:MAG: long-chain fatty acid--CoA ligase [Deltaproteobacteria bacterium]
MPQAAVTQKSAAAATSFQSVPDMWHYRVRSTPNADAVFLKDPDGTWRTLSWSEAGDQVRRVANGLLAQGLKAEERICILCNTRWEWIVADLAIMCAGGATTTIYPSNTPKECAYIIGDCDAVAVVVENDEQAAKLLEVRDEIPNVRRVYVIDGTPSEDGWIVTLATLASEGDAFAEGHPDTYDEVSSAIGPERLATLIYTSGTTGVPKGVMITHDSWVFESEAIDKMGFITPADKQFLFLPLAHVFAKIMQVIFIRLGVPTAIDGNLDALIDNLAVQQPTWMGAVPRVFEKAYAKIVSNAREAGGAKLALFNWAVNTGREVSKLKQRGQNPTGFLKLRAQLADRLVFSKVRAVFGGRLRFLVSGGAPLAPEIAEFFHACGILVLEGYGMTESTAATCVNTPDDFQFGTVGRPIPGASVRIADDGEILIHGRGVMRGYHGLPEATAEALDDEGWLHSGDLGQILPTGHLKITGRKKDLIITAGGKNIGPAHFQNLLKARSPWVSQVLMHGDRRPYCVALVTINEEAVAKWAADQGLSFADYADLSSKIEVKALVQADVDAINKELPSYETVKKIALCPEDWTTDNGFLTPSMKVKRAIVETHYQDLLNGLYDT